MEIQKKIFDKLLSLIPGGIFGLLTCAIVLTGDIISMILFPEGYNFFENMISELGHGSSGIFFNLGLIISGILSFPYYIALYRSFDKETVNPLVRKSSLIFSLISIITYILVGIFPSIEDNYIIFVTHGIFAFLSFLTGVFYLISFSILMLMGSTINGGKYSKFIACQGFIVAGTYLLILFTWLPITEWIATFAIISWIIANSIYLIYHKL
ncbi:MAG: DUF998 domain-containing protein [Promethearchaeota archaeon]|nr:MAG: DUF998 domain-containing protein [Candidatus Lokiarchaeota archaeon]